jgi:hypothetical protein
MRHEMGLVEEDERPSFLRWTVDRLAQHCMDEHGPVWQTLVTGEAPV